MASGFADLVLGSTWRPSSPGTAVIEVRDPQDGGLIAIVPSASREDVEIAIEKATAAALRARRTPTHERMELLHRAADRVAADAEDFARTIAREGVKTIREARREVARCVETLRLSAEETRRIGGESINFDQRAGDERRIGYWYREPLGVVLAITPFNDPLNLVAHKVGPAIAAGNAVVVKPHSATPLSALKLADAFTAAGLPDGLLQVITGRGSEIGPVLAAHPDVAMVTFTGGTGIGLLISREAAGKRIVLELGSNSPVIVLADADLESAVGAICSGAFAAAGQNCLHVQRLIVEEQVRSELEDRLVAATEALRVGDKQSDSTDMGPLISLSEARRVTWVIDEAVLLGGRVLTGGKRMGTFMDPTLIGNLPLESSLALEEVFGPVTGITGVDSLDAAIAVANETHYGLHAAIFTRDLGSAMRAVRELSASTVLVNDSSDFRLDAMPFGGVKGSGIGREGVPFAVQEMTVPKVVCFNL